MDTTVFGNFGTTDYGTGAVLSQADRIKRAVTWMDGVGIVLTLGALIILFLFYTQFLKAAAQNPTGPDAKKNLNYAYTSLAFAILLAIVVTGQGVLWIIQQL